MGFWEVLGIEPTKDEKIIKKAYAQKSRTCHPEDDQEGFLELQEAYRLAVAYLSEEEEQINFEQPLGEKMGEEAAENLEFSSNQEADKKPEKKKGNLFADEEEFEAIALFLNVYELRKGNDKQEFERKLLGWAKSDIFLDVFLNPKFLQTFSVTVLELHEATLMDEELERLLCMIYACSYFLEETEHSIQYHLVVERGCEFDGLHHITNLLELRASKTMVTRGYNENNLGALQILGRGYQDYRKWISLLEKGLDSFYTQLELKKIMLFYTYEALVLRKVEGREVREDKQRHESAVGLLLHFIKSHTLPNKFLGFLLEHLQIDTTRSKSEYDLFHDLLEEMEQQFDSDSYEAKEGAVKILKLEFKKLLTSTLVKTERITVRAPLGGFPVFQDLYQEVDLEQQSFTAKNKQLVDDFFDKYGEKRELLSSQEFIEHKFLYDIFDNDKDIYENGSLNLYLLDRFQEYYQKENSVQKPYIARVQKGLDSLLYSKQSYEHFLLPQPVATEKIQLPQAMETVYFWNYFFANAFPHGLLENGESLRYYIEEHYTPNIPWIFAFTQYNPLEREQIKRTKLAINLHRRIVIHFEESAIIYTVDGKKLEDNESFFTLQQVLEIAKESSRKFFLLLPLVREAEQEGFRGIIQDKLEKMLLFTGLHWNITNGIISHITTDSSAEKTNLALEQWKNRLMESFLWMPTKRLDVESLSVDDKVKKLLEMVKLPYKPLREDEYQGSTKGVTLSQIPPSRLDVQYYKSYQNTKKITLGYSDSVAPPFTQQFYLRTIPFYRRKEVLFQKSDSLRFPAGVELLAEIGVCYHYPSYLAVDVSEGVYLIKVLEGKLFLGDSLEEVLEKYLAAQLSFDKLKVIFASSLESNA